ncbi:MAG TPA: tetraacyldisaccharide 4'-kinase [Parvularcula sp.]|nr:tetraacyldisaccharide 4'-kinase [Parvularcula sp.]HBS30660.1 tetraacyldisaccharide 4'-kinase [Parvularcula sp.]
MNDPWFWRGASPAARLSRAALAPAAALYGAGQRWRIRSARPFDPGIPVICAGAAVIGGAGKTPFCLMLQRLLHAEGVAAHFLTRGYKGGLKGPVRVDAQHTVDDVGDEALILAAAAPAWVAKDRAAGAGAAAAAGAGVIIMDDGFQNPAVKKTLSFLLLTGEEENLARFPAGPLRETAGEAMARADAVVLAFPRRRAAEAGGVPAFHAAGRLSLPLPPQRVAAFCGIARPERFFAALEAQGFTLASRRAFADHHAFAPGEIARLKAGAAGLPLITTEKDFVRLCPADRAGVAVARLALEAEDPDSLVRFVRERINR